MNLFLLIQAAQTAQPEEITGEKGMNYFEMALNGGLIMIPLALLSVIAVYIFFERFFALKKAAKEDASFMNKIKDYIHDGKIDSALTLCQSQQFPIARMIEKGVSRIGRPLSDVNTAIENVGNLEVSRLEKGLPTLATVLAVPP